jgi:predicted transcriptional regulator
MYIGSPSLSESIVATLKRHGTVPAEFLAKIYNRELSEIESYLETLEDKGVIRREGENVSLQTGSENIVNPLAGTG